MRNKRFLKKLGAGTLAALMAVSSIPVNATELYTEATTEFFTESVSESATTVETETSAPETTFETETPVETDSPEITVPDYVETEAQESTDGFTETKSPETPGFTDDTSQTDITFDNEPETDSESVAETEENSFRVTVKEEHADVYFASDLLKLKNGTLEDPDLLLDPVPETEADTKEKAEKRAAAIEAAQEILPNEYTSILTDDAYKLLMKQHHDFDGATIVGFYVVPEDGYEVGSVKAYVENNELEIMDYENSAYEITMPDENIVLEVKTVESSVEKETETETEVETEVETETDENRVGFLEAKSAGMDMTILAPDESGFPEGSELKLYAGAELKQIYGEEDESWTYEEFLNNLKDEWKEQLTAKYAETHPEQEITEDAVMGMLQSIYPFYFEVVAKDGSEVPLSDDIKVYTNFYDEETYNAAEKEESDYAVGYHDLAELYLTPNSEVTLNTEKHCLAVDTDAKENGLYSFVQIKQSDEKISCTCGSTTEDPLAHEWDCPVFWEAFMQDCNCGSSAHKVTGHNVSCEAVWKAFDASCSGCEAKGVYALHDNCEVLSRIHRELCNCGTDYTNLDEAVETHDENSDFVVYLMALSDFLNNQISTVVSGDGNRVDSKISKTSGWTDGTGHADSDYLPMKFYSGKTTWELLGKATANQWVKTKIDGYTQAWQPVAANLSDRTSHGARYNNVIYDYTTGDWYDVEFVIYKYNSTTNNGTTIYPYVGFRHDTLKFDFDRSGDVVLQCNIFKAGTDTYAKLKVKLPIWDIDNGQYVGIKQYSEGSMDHRYYYPGADAYLRAGNDISVCGSTFSYVEGIYGQQADNLNTPAACAVWEMTTARFYFALGYYNNSTVTWATRLERYNKMKSGGLADGGTYAVVSIYSQDNVAPALQTPVKRVSSNNSTFGTSNTLSKTTANYYYRIDYPVLDTIPSYHFSSMVMQDTLPKGADYVDSLKVTSVQDGVDRTKWFTTSTTGDVIKLTATSAALASNDFYGLTYRITFKVKMDPTEISPAYSTDGKATYTVKNTASVTVKRGNATTAKNTNQVTTTASASRAAYATPSKGIDGKASLTTKKIGMSDTITFSVFQKTVEADSVVAPTNIIMTDVLDNSLQYESFKVYYIKDGAWAAHGNFNATTNGQTVTIKHAGGSFTSATTWRFDITCKIKAGYNLSSYIKTLSDGYKYYVIPNSAKVTLKFPGGNDIAKSTNKVTVYTSLGVGKLKVNKTISGGTATFRNSIPKTNKTFSFTLKGTATNGQAVNKTFTVVGGSSSTISNIPVGKYTLTESYSSSKWTCTSTNPQSVTITANGTTEKTFDNKAFFGTLTVTKKVSGVDTSKITDEEDKTFKFVLSGKSTYGTTVNETRSLVGAGSVSFKNIPIGTYKLTESFDSSRWSSSNESQSITITKDQTKTVSITNTYTFNPSRTPQPAPEKSFDGKRNIRNKQITKRSDLVTFSIYQQVKASEYEESAPTGLTIRDELEPAFEIVDKNIYKSTDSGLSWKSASSSFVFESSKMKNGYTLAEFHTPDNAAIMKTAVWYRADITVRIQSDYAMESYLQEVNDTEMYVIPNKASSIFTYSQGTPKTVKKNTNTVEVLMPIDELRIIVKKANEVTGENIPNAEFTVYEWDGSDYSINAGKMTYVSGAVEEYQIEHLQKTDVNQGKFKIVETVTPWGHTGSWSKEVVVGNNAEETYEATNPMGTGTITIIKKNKHEELLEGAVYSITAKENVVSPQGQVLIAAGTKVDEVTTGEDGAVVSKELYPGKYIVEETKAPQGYALNKTPQDVEVLYKDKDTKVTNVEVVFVNERLYSTIEVTKEIDTDSVVWAHGNPTFTFKVTGTDLVGVEHTYYDTVEFTQNNIGSGNKSTLTVTFNVPTGIYTVSEEKTVRYAFGNIHDVVNGTIDGETAVIDVSGKKDGTEETGTVGKATFYNKKVTDEDLTHTAFVRNTIA